MKVLRCLLALLLIVSMTIGVAACSKTPEDGVNTIPDESENNHHLKVVAEYDPMNWGCSTSKGYYDSIDWPRDMYSEKSEYIHIKNLMYTDYDSHTRVYLCNTPGCAHNNENCTSFIKYSAGLLLFCDANEKYLFCISSGAIQGKAEYEEEIGSLIRCNLDGSNRVELLKLKPTESFSYAGKVFSDEEYIYLVILKYDLENDEVFKVLRRVNIETGESEDLSVGSTMTGFESVIQDDCLLKVECLDNSWTLSKYSPYDNKEDLIMKLPSTGTDEETYWSGEDLVKVDIQNGTVTVSTRGLFSEETKTVQNLPCNPAGGVSLVKYESDLGYADISFYDAITDERLEYIVNFNDGSFKKNELYYINTTYKMPFQIISEYDDKYMVIIGESEKKTITQVDQNGVAHTYEYEGRPLYATMLKEDYWNQNPVYEIIDDQI